MKRKIEDMAEWEWVKATSVWVKEKEFNSFRLHHLNVYHTLFDLLWNSRWCLLSKLPSFGQNLKYFTFKIANLYLLFKIREVRLVNTLQTAGFWGLSRPVFGFTEMLTSATSDSLMYSEVSSIWTTSFGSCQMSNEYQCARISFQTIPIPRAGNWLRRISDPGCQRIWMRRSDQVFWNSSRLTILLLKCLYIYPNMSNFRSRYHLLFQSRSKKVWYTFMWCLFNL